MDNWNVAKQCKTNKMFCFYLEIAVLPLWIFRPGQFYKFVFKSWCPCTKYIIFGVEIAEWTRKASFCPYFWNSIFKHTEPKSQHRGLEGALNCWLNNLWQLYTRCIDTGFSQSICSLTSCCWCDTLCTMPMQT